MLNLSRALSAVLFAAVLGNASALSGCLPLCGGADFDAGETEASIYLTDAATEATIAEPTFSVDGTVAYASCGELDEKDPSRCISQIVVLRKGVHTITVEAAGYEAQTVDVDTTSIGSVHVAVQLEPVQE